MVNSTLYLLYLLKGLRIPPSSRYQLKITWKKTKLLMNITRQIIRLFWSNDCYNDFVLSNISQYQIITLLAEYRHLMNWSSDAICDNMLKLVFRDITLVLLPNEYLIIISRGQADWISAREDVKVLFFRVTFLKRNEIRKKRFLLTDELRKWQKWHIYKLFIKPGRLSISIE